MSSNLDCICSQKLIDAPGVFNYLMSNLHQHWLDNGDRWFCINFFDAEAINIQHRLHIAGRDEPLFTPAATGLIGGASRGIPRSINILCDTTLVYGYSTNAEKIDVNLVREVIKKSC